ncbi:DUF6266 family protein [Pedobacter mucosus]|uniref:DUF6266 family protein n=1 Tax=Pedobacter mucosus TaxID=2895286 RepID=UPI001EE4D07C|nr:DUF6266 family protein [Pedobacter mucosus]UKT62163.1 DUF6266 family protein [Pedobacter mucosus]
MATFKNGILGGFSGKVGSVVGFQLGDKFVMRAMPRSRSAFTEKELENQQKFRMVQLYLSPFKDLLRVGFNNYYTKTGGFRAALSYTRKEAIKQDDDGICIDHELIKISGGNLAPAINPEVEIATHKEITIRWDTYNLNYLNESDQLMLLVYDPTSRAVCMRIFNGTFRKAGEFRVLPPQKLFDTQVNIYIGFVAADRNSQSDSQYLGSFIL